MPVQRMKKFLDEHDVKYAVIQHSVAYTAQEVAASAHVSGKDLAKTVIVLINDEMAMAVLPASYKIDLKQLKSATGADEVRLASEDEFKDRFPECEVGAMPPFGNLYDMDVFVAATLAEDEQIAFNAGNHHELVQMSYADYERLVDPIKLQFAGVHA